jgi:hypothetical protein
LLLGSLQAGSALAADKTAFAEGASAYQSGNYAAAATAWGSPGKTSSGTLHNLGNAEFRLGHPGAAILAWERALALMPGSKNTAANLRFARAQAGLNEPQYAWYEKYAALLSPGVWLGIATLTFWSSVAFLALPPLLKRRRAAWTQAGAVVASALFLLTTPALAGIASRSRIGVILVADTELRLTPTKEAEVLGKLSEGELGRLEKARGDYVFVRGAADRAGWIQTKEFARIWP